MFAVVPLQEDDDDDAVHASVNKELSHADRNGASAVELAAVEDEDENRLTFLAVDEGVEHDLVDDGVGVFVAPNR
jgi:hypothetical protein